MKIDLEKMIAISKVNQNFSEAARLTDEHELLTIMKNSKPRFVLMTFEKFREYEANRDNHTNKK
ncbi:type II toxin-antitoxin system Phd/YefM family antitoxin [Paenibacillus sp. FSL W7-1279]|uniref:type II toxin-antitoxin system Phd/YefM family antitoxin n=1 Tax=Paenibacillus sp. FSL W7-1279 TaxID=2921697 RepID=UPI0030D9D019